MNFIYRLCLICFILVHFYLPGSSQVFSTQGTDFWFYRNRDLNYVRLLICSDFNTNVTINYYEPGKTFVLNKSITAGTCDTIKVNGLSKKSYIQSCDTVGSSIHSLLPVSVYMLASSDTTPTTLFANSNLLFPVQVAGYDYLAMCYLGATSDVYYHSLSFFDNTQIKITPTIPNPLGGPVSPYTVLLPAAGVWSENADPDDLTGSKLESTLSGGSKKPFMIFSGRYAVQGTPLTFGDKNSPFSQQLPIEKWGSYFHSVPHLTRAGDDIRILAAFDSTTVILNGQDTIFLNSQQWYDTLLVTPGSFTADKPVNITEVSRDAIADSVVNSDCFMYPLVNDSNLLTRALFATDWNAYANGVITAYYLNMVCKTSNTGNVILNGNNVGASFIPFTYDSAWSYAQLSITNGTHLLLADSGVIAYVYGYGPHRGHGNIVGGNEMLYLNPVNDNSKSSFSLAVHPNPADNILYLNWSNFNPQLCIFRNILGVEVKRELLQNYYFTTIGFQIQDLSPGLYFVTLVSTKGEITQKFVKE
jgi:hypothetical protein